MAAPPRKLRKQAQDMEAVADRTEDPEIRQLLRIGADAMLQLADALEETPMQRAQALDEETPPLTGPAFRNQQP